jgi:hypothetical protein
VAKFRENWPAKKKSLISSTPPASTTVGHDSRRVTAPSCLPRWRSRAAMTQVRSVHTATAQDIGPRWAAVSRVWVNDPAPAMAASAVTGSASATAIRRRAALTSRPAVRAVLAEVRPCAVTAVPGRPGRSGERRVLRAWLPPERAGGRPPCRRRRGGAGSPRPGGRTVCSQGSVAWRACRGAGDGWTGTEKSWQRGTCASATGRPVAGWHPLARSAARPPTAARTASGRVPVAGTGDGPQKLADRLAGFANL